MKLLRCKTCGSQFIKFDKFNYRNCPTCRRLRKSKDIWDAYKLRNRLVKNLGYKSYRGYLLSKKWQTIKTQVLKRDHFKCRICGNFANQVHHKRYDRATITGRSIKGLMSICAKCHKHIEFKNDKKIGLNKANKRIEKVNKNNLLTEYDALKEIKAIMGTLE